MAEIAILLNPVADNGKASRKQKQLEFILGSHDVSYRLFVSESEAHLRKLVKDIPTEYHTIVGAGGDGTFNIIVNELMIQKLDNRFAMIPLGSQNDIAREFGVDSLEDACYALRIRKTVQVDLGVITADKQEPMYFLGTASLGLGTTVNKFVEEVIQKYPYLANFKQFVGLVGCNNSFSKEEVPLHITLNYGEIIDGGKFSLVVFNNTRFYAGGLKPSPNAKPDDSYLDCCYIKNDNFWQFLWLLFLARNEILHPNARAKTIPAHQFRIRSNDNIEIQADGQILGAYKDITLAVKSKALSVIVNPKYSEN